MAACFVLLRDADAGRIFGKVPLYREMTAFPLPAYGTAVQLRVLPGEPCPVNAVLGGPAPAFFRPEDQRCQGSVEGGFAAFVFPLNQGNAFGKVADHFLQLAELVNMTTGQFHRSTSFFFSECRSASRA